MTLVMRIKKGPVKPVNTDFHNHGGNIDLEIPIMSKRTSTLAPTEDVHHHHRHHH
jgi:hypothetical protein